MIENLTKINVNDYIDEYKKLESQIVWSYFPNDLYPQSKQSSIQYKYGEDPWSSGVGTSEGKELEYDQINPIFSGTLFEKIIQEYDLKRSRFMWLGPKSCYSMHRDKTGRLHVPLISNNQCFMIFKKGIIQYLHPGYIYSVDTKNIHTAINGSPEWRLHFIGCLSY
jgi:hypothetical protein